MYSTLATPVLAERAQRAVSDPDLSPYSDQTSTALGHTVGALAETHAKHGAPAGLDVLRELSLAILVDFDEREQQRAATDKFHRDLATLTAERNALADAEGATR